MRAAPQSHRPHDPAGSDPAGGACAGDSCVFAVVLIDNYPLLRRHLGRNAGTRAIEAVAERIAAAAPEAALAVVGRDRIELASTCGEPECAQRLLARVDAACAAPFTMAGEDHRVEVLIGASTAPASEQDELRLVEDAEQALDEARIERQPIVRALSRPDALDRIALKRDLGEAIAAESLFVHYQPKIHLRREEVAGLEALLRWRHPTRGLISPADFIPIAEESRDIVQLTLWTLRRVIEDQRKLARLGYDHVIFVNVSGVLLGDARFVQAVRELVPPSGARIGFEITERRLSAIRRARSLT